jgi:predicted extracellular nuclease
MDVHTARRASRLFLAVALVVATVAIGATGTSGSGVVALSDNGAVLQTFDTLSNGAASTSLPAGWYLTELGTGTAADGAYSVGTGSSNAGGAYSFGAAGAGDRALGSIGSGSVATIMYGARLTNNGSGPITALSIAFDGEMWRRGQSAVNADGLTFSYSTDASDLATGTFTNVAALNFVSPGNACLGAAGATDGNSAACRTSVSSSITGLSVNPGSTIWIRWTDTDTAGSDDGVAIDNVSVTATFSSDPTPPVASGVAAPNPASPGQTVTLSGAISPGFNPLSQSYTVTCDLSPIGGVNGQIVPNDGATFSYSITLPGQPHLGVSTVQCSVVDDQARFSSFSIGLTILLPLDEHCGAVATPVSSIQGSGALSPLAGQTVDAEAVVVADFQRPGGLSGFYIEAPPTEQDGDPATSEGVFVFSSTPVDAGDRVRVRGVVSEFASSTGSAISHLTELGAISSIQVCSANAAMPVPVEITLPIDDQAYWERYEGMLVQFKQQLVVTGNFSLGQFGQIDLAPGVLYQPTQRVGTTATWAAATDLVLRSRIALDDGSTQSGASLNGGTVAPYPSPGLSDANTLRVGALVNPNGNNPPVPLIGVLDDRFGAYRLQPISPVTFSNAANPRPATADVAAAAGARFRLVSANVLNFFTTLGSRGAATAAELDHQRAKIVAELSQAGGDVFGLSELQNFANGGTNGGTYTNAAVADLAAALAQATGRHYQYLDTIDGARLAAGNTAADNGTDAIRSGIIYDGDAVVPVGQTALYYQGDQNRPTLAQTFRPAAGIHPERQTFTVVVNHFRSKGSPCGSVSDDPFQGNCNGMRLSMAANVSTWLEGNPTSDPAGENRRYIVIGDFNAYFGEDPIQALVRNGAYTDLIDSLLGDTAYSFNFGSQVGYLDHALANAAALPLVKDAAELHVNADEPPALQALDSAVKSAAAQVAYYAPNEFAASDHDPIVIGFNPLLGDFTDDGILDARDLLALLGAIEHGHSQSGQGSIDRRTDMNQDGVVTQEDVKIWLRVFIDWKQSRK